MYTIMCISNAVAAIHFLLDNSELQNEIDFRI